MYTKIAQEDDNKLNERCQREMDGILVFVSRHVCFPVGVYVNWKN